MENKLKEMCNVPDQILALLQKDIAEIKVALLGNEYNPAGGLLYRTSELEKQVELTCVELERMKNKYDKIIWTVAGGATVIAVVANLIMQLFDKIVM